MTTESNNIIYHERFTPVTQCTCNHKNISFNDEDRTAICSDCGNNLDLFDAFSALAKQAKEQNKRLDIKRKYLQALEARTLPSKALNRIKTIYKSNTTIPACPHCGTGLTESDLLKAKQTHRLSIDTGSRQDSARVIKLN